MATVLYDSPVFGPVHSRRLGVSLGINLMPADGKICTFNCIYCECGFNGSHHPKHHRPTRKEVYDVLRSTLEQMKANGLAEGDITFDEGSIKEMIGHYTMEAGVRQLERLVASNCRKAVVELLSKPETVKPIAITEQKVQEYLGVELFEGSKKEKENQIGVVTGLAYTEFGGDILPIEVTYFPGKGGLVLTGKLGDVMKESAAIALDYVRANSKKYHIDDEIFQKNDIHIHVPEGAVPKDGPSAGVAITTAIISSLSDTPVDANVAMTGEVTLRGKALPIGGLREKSLAALRSGIKHIIVPIDNKKDVSELPEEVKKSLQISFMKTVDEALAIALVHPEA